LEVSKLAKTTWFVESRGTQGFEGWYTAPEKEIGRWITTDPHKAKRYTEAEARAVAQALTYFHNPFRWSEWIATEHIFMDEEVK
jgi:hypothetical protein